MQAPLGAFFSGLGGCGEVCQLPEILGTVYGAGKAGLKIKRKMNHCAALLLNDRASSARLLWSQMLGRVLQSLARRVSKNYFHLIPVGQLCPG